jgi:hypothetical protein
MTEIFKRKFLDVQNFFKHKAPVNLNDNSRTEMKRVRGGVTLSGVSTFKFVPKSSKELIIFGK